MLESNCTIICLKTIEKYSGFNINIKLLAFPDGNYLRKMGREKYILNHEIELLYGSLDPTSILMIYQHLPNNKHIHEAAVTKKLIQAKASNPDAFVCAYREDDLAFLFMVREVGVFDSLCACLTQYHSMSGHKYKSLHLTLNHVKPAINSELKVTTSASRA